MTENDQPRAINLRNGHLKHYLAENLPHLAEDHTGPVQAIELAEVLERAGSIPTKTKRVYVAGWMKGAFGISLAYVTDSIYNPDTERFDSLDSSLYDKETNTIKAPQFQWVNHFENYTTLERLQK